MSGNLQPIPLGLIAIQPYVDVITDVYTFSVNELNEMTYQDDNFENPPSVFIDGLLLTYAVVTDRRYIVFDSISKTITFKNGNVATGEIVQIFL